MTTLDVLRVFVGPDGGGGNPLGVFVDGTAIASGARQQVARDLGFSETVFVDSDGSPPGSARVGIFTPGTQLAFAGHPTVGTAWLLAERGRPVDRLIVPAGEVRTWREVDRTWVRARASWIHPMELVQHRDAAAVEALQPPPPGGVGTYAWAWEDEVQGRIRARYFANDIGIVEDEATGAAAVLIGDRLGRPLTIRQGVGSELLVRPGPDGTIDIGGITEAVEQRPFDA
ncbi:MAG: PhzF family phenazine biosynthesis protein [Chloroflexota bacterium]